MRRLRRTEHRPNAEHPAARHDIAWLAAASLPRVRPEAKIVLD